MKSTVLIILLLFCGRLFGQEIPKKANTIIITDTLLQKAFYDGIINILFESGYGVLSSDEAHGTITTSPKPIKAGTVKLNILIKDNRVSIRGEFQGPSIELYGVTDNSPLIINYMGMKNSLAMKAWNEMQSVADQIPGKKEYLIK